MLYYTFCKALEEIRNSKSDKKRQIISNLIQEFRQECPEQSTFQILRLLLPHLDKDRNNYGLKESKLADVIIDTLNLSRGSHDAFQLKHWKQHGSRGSVDFASVAYSVLQERSSAGVKNSQFQVSDLNKLLDTLSDDGSEKKSVMLTILTKMSPLEQAWTIRIILKEMKFGISENTIFKLYHPDAFDFYLVCSDLKQVCLTLVDPLKRYSNCEVQIFHPFKPMLAERENIEAIKLISFYIETKLDGERIQIHKQGNMYKYWSRNSTDYTYLYGDSPLAGSLTKHIHSLFNESVQNVILDGEMIVFDPVKNEFLPFGSLKNAAAHESLQGPNDPHVCFVVFDLVYLNGQSYVQYPLRQRLARMNGIFQCKKGYLEIVERIESSNVAEITDAVDNAILNKEEGIVIKDTEGIYEPGKRSSTWIKIKPEYIDDVATDLDVLVVGAYYGKRSSGQISTLMCALRDESKFLSFCKVGSGFSTEQLEVFRNLFSTHGKPFAPQPHNWLVLAPPFKEKPDLVLADPSISVVITVKAASIVPSVKYGAQYTLRFPRFIKICHDRNFDSCMTLAEMHQIRRMAEGQLAVRAQGSTSLGGMKRKKTKVQRKPQVGIMFQGADVRNLDNESNLFNGLEFCVTHGSESFTKHELEIMISKNAGEIVQNPTSKTKCVISGKSGEYYILTINPGIKETNLMKQGSIDIVNVDWCVNSVNSKTILPFQPKFMIFATKTTKEAFKEIVDDYGDSYLDPLEPQTLLKIMNSMENIPYFDNPQLIVKEVEERYLVKNIFRDWIVLVTHHFNYSAMKISFESLLVFYGASVKSEMSSNVNMIIGDLVPENFDGTFYSFEAFIEAYPLFYIP